MKSFRSFFGLVALAVMAAVASVSMTACAAFTATPTDSQVAAIQSACAIDAGLRPIVTGLINVPGLAQSGEAEAVDAARAIIDPVCANPAGSLQANTLMVFSESTAEIINVIGTLQARKTKAARTPGPASSASAS